MAKKAKKAAKKAPKKLLRRRLPRRPRRRSKHRRFGPGAGLDGLPHLFSTELRADAGARKAQGTGTREPSARRQRLPQVARRSVPHNPT
jgi:hypothetical protein